MSKVLPKFLPGDIIRFIGPNDMGISWLNIGDTAKVILDNRTDRIKFDFIKVANPQGELSPENWFGEPDSWEKVSASSEASKPRFKVGDKLQYIGPNNCGISLMRAGDIVEVINDKSREDYDYGANNFKFKYIFAREENLVKTNLTWRGVADSWRLLKPESQFQKGDVIEFVGPDTLGINGLTAGDIGEVVNVYPKGSFFTNDEIIQLRFLSAQAPHLLDDKENTTWNCYADSWKLADEQLILERSVEKAIDEVNAIEVAEAAKSKPKFKPGDKIYWKGGRTLGVSFLQVGDVAIVIRCEYGYAMDYKLLKLGDDKNCWAGDAEDWELAQKPKSKAKPKEQIIILDSLD